METANETLGRTRVEGAFAFERSAVDFQHGKFDDFTLRDLSFLVARRFEVEHQKVVVFLRFDQFVGRLRHSICQRSPMKMCQCNDICKRARAFVRVIAVELRNHVNKRASLHESGVIASIVSAIPIN